MRKRIWKKFISLSVAFCMVFALTGVLPVNAACEVGSVGDGWGYFFFRATGLDSSCKIAYQVNGGEKVFLESDFQSNWIRIDKEDLNTDGENTITLYTGDTSGVLDESKTRKDAGTGCCDYSVTTARLTLVLPDGRVICKDSWGALKQEGEPFTITTYTPVDDSTVLTNKNKTAEFTGAQLQIGDDKITKAYKADITFDTSLWNGTNDPDPVTVPTLKNVSIQIGATPSDRRFVWYSKSENTGYLQYTTIDKLINGVMPSDATKVAAASSVSGDTDYYSFMADISGLADNTTYAYRVGNDDAWSQVYTFKTDDGENPFSFIVGSDIQIGQLQEYDFNENGVSGVQKEIDGWVDTYNKISQKNPDASFFMSLGDQVSDAYIERQYDGLFASEQMTSIPFVPVYGNHDDEYNWKKHYNLPNTTEYGANNYGACNYSFVYGDALFMHLTFSNLPEQHTAFIEETLQKHPDVKWRIVILHTPFFGASTQESDDYPLRDALAPELSRLGIDVVLAGHQHVYCRAKMMNGTTPNDSYDYDSITEIVNPNASDVLYMTIGSASGSAYNNLSTLGNHVVKAWRQYEPNISNVEITDNFFTIDTYKTTDMTTPADTFTLKREGTAPVVKSVHISTENTTVKAGTTQAFTSTALGLNNPSQSVIWSVSGNENAGTTINENGVLTVAAAEFSESLTVTATSAVDSAKYASVNLDVETTSTTINVGQGVTYKLPGTVNGLAVTEWTDYNGDKVEKVDTEFIGCRYYIATLSDGTQYVYRVNVGEYKEFMRDDFEGYSESEYETKITDKNINGGTFSKSAAENTDGKGIYLKKDGTNTVLAMGPYQTSWANTATWSLTADNPGDAFKVSVKLRVVDFDPSKSSGSTNYFMQLRPNNTSGVSFRVKSNSSDEITATEVHYESTSSGNADVKKYVTWEKSGTAYSMKDYVKLAFEGNGVQYSTYLNDVELSNSQIWSGTNVATKGLDKINVGKTDKFAATNAVTYIDEVVYSKAIYVTDNVKKQSVNTAITQGAGAAQSSTVTLNMSDGTTKDFTVNYTADTTTAGTKTASGTIDGFDDTITVKYTVSEKTVINSIENNAESKTQVIINNKAVLPDGAKLFVAVFNASDVMQKIRMVDLNAAQRSVGEQTIILTENLLDSAASVRAFVWSSKLEPLALMKSR